MADFDIHEIDSKRQEMASDATLRDYFAVSAMQSALTGGLNDGQKKSGNYINAVAELSYIVADAMLAARNK